MMSDHLQWVDQRQKSKDFLENWEPIWSPDFFSKRAFQNRVYWANKSFKNLVAFHYSLLEGMIINW